MNKRLFHLLFLLLTVVLCKADEQRLINAYLSERSFIDKQGIQETISQSGSILTSRLQEFKDASTQVALPQPLTGYQKIDGKAQFNLQERYEKCPSPLGTAFDYTTGPNGMVLPFNGELINEDQDLQLPARGGIGFSLIRRYSSYDKSDFGLGIGWRHNYDIFILERNGSQYSLYLNTHIVNFKPSNINHVWQSDAGDFLELNRQDNNLIKVYDASLTCYEFEKAYDQNANFTRWRLVKIVSRQDNWSRNSLEFHYLEKSDRIDYVLDPFQNRIEFFYEQSGHLAAVSTPFSYVTFSYSDNNELIQCSYPPRKGLDDESSSQQIEYEYQAGWLISKQSKSLPFKLVIDYNASKQVCEIGSRSGNAESLWRLSYDGHKTSVIPPFPLPRADYVFASPVHPSLPTIVSHPDLSSQTSTDYNKDGLPVKQIAPIGRVDVFEYNEGCRRALFRGNLIAERSYPAKSLHSDWNEQGKEIQYHSEIGFPISKLVYQINKDGTRQNLKQEHFEYSDGNFLLNLHTESGQTTRYWFNVYGEPAIVLQENGTATLYEYANSCSFSPYDFQNGLANGSGYLAAKTTTNVRQIINDAFNALNLKPVSLPTRYLPDVTKTEKYSYDCFGKVIRTQSSLADDLAIYNVYGDLLASFSLENGVSVFSYTPWGKPSRTLHQFAPAQNAIFKGRSHRLFAGQFYTESFEYDALSHLYKHYQTDEPAYDGVPRMPFVYERFPSGKVSSIVSPEGIKRTDIRDEVSGLLKAQMLEGKDSSKVTLTSDIEYYADGIVKSVIDRFGGKCTYLVDGFGNNYAEIMPNGVVTQVMVNALGQEVSKWSHKDNVVLARTDNVYNDRNQLSEVLVYSIYNNETKVIKAEAFLYDNVGNVSAKRTAKEGAWTYYLYDGFNREIGSLSPENNLSFTFYGKSLPFCSVNLVYNQNSRKAQRVGNYTEFDYCGRKTVSIPITNTGRLARERSVHYSYDTVGKLVSTISAEQIKVTKRYDTLGNILHEERVPLSNAYNEKPILTDFYYDQSGKLARKELENDSLALIQNGDAVIPEQKKAPQITRVFYDALARMYKSVQPDGLVQEYVYNEHSLPIRMKWYHTSSPENILRDLTLTYSDLGQCLAIMDAKTGKTLRQNQFDLMGNCVKSIDVDFWGKEIVLNRTFDSTGSKRLENTQYAHIAFPTQKFDYDLTAGIMTKQWVGLNRTSLRFWEKEIYSLDSEGRLAEIRLDKAKQPFATWAYLGNQTTVRRINESCLTSVTSFNDFLEPIEQIITNHIQGKQVGKLDYGYGRQGQPEFSSSKLITENTQKDYVFSSYSRFDSFRRLVAQNTERVSPPANAGWQKRATQLFDVPSESNLAALQTQRMAYDQANNIWLNYSGGYFMPADLSAFERKHNPVFSSAAPPILLSMNGNVQDLDLLELASNRDVSKASFASENEGLKAESQIYDKMGCLIEYDGTYWNGSTRRRAKWKLTYDALGRLVLMNAYALDESAGIRKDYHLAELHFSYDSENRRIRKEVIDYTPARATKDDTTYTLYTGNNQSVVFIVKDNKLLPREQYLWKTGTRELLMAAMPLDYAQGIASQAIERFYFQQDKNLNVIFTSKCEHSKFVTVSAMSYFGFGENATQADITQIKSSLQAQNSSLAYNVTLDDMIPGQWFNIPEQPQYIELDLATTDKLSALKIWTGARFPDTFGVFVLPPDFPSPATNNLSEWVLNAKQYQVEYVHNRCYGNSQKSLDWETPYTIPLRDQRGDRVVILWEKAPVDRIEVREFEVIKVPNNPVAISFAGQWLDAETNLYYQINRYRLAGSNKFISPDPLGYFDGNNLYAYAHNNPLEWHDPDGQWAHIVAGAGIGAILGGGMYALNCWISGEEFSWAEFGVSVLAGAASGAIAAALLPVNPILAGAVAGAVGGAIMEGGITYIRTGDFKASLVAAGKGALWGAAAGAFAGGLGIFSGSSSGWMAGLAKSVASGAGTGGLFGGLRRATEVYMATGDWTTALSAARNSAFRGTIMGGIAGAAGYSISRAVNSGMSHHHKRGGEGGYSNDTYKRPAGFRQGVRDKVWEANREASTGQVRDPLTGKFMSKNSPWDMGHKPGYEWWKFKDYARTNNLSRQEVLDWNNNPDHFRPELPSSNRCHLAEDMTSAFFGGSAPYEASSGSGLLDIFSGDFSFEF